ncbi:hypothetical protein ACIRD2_06550 [Streptomyces sp. NPDC093595]|uniref:hypothetical protein n=1 Tax=Streptomyces sp. NPDC093595 TaxID=3366045 RepID=UPI0037FDBEBF
MAKRRKSLIDDVLDRTGDVGRDARKLTRRALTGKKKKKKSARKLAKRNSRAIEVLAAQLERYIRHDREMARQKTG